jgi:oxygen-independent coproporphyrinogen III oxidase
MEKHSLYIHIPFCTHRCGYCDFNTFEGLESLIPQYVEALKVELKFIAWSKSYSIPIHTIYFGGGTPSLLTTDQIKSIIDCVNHEFDISPETEITLEVNPGSVNRKFFFDLIDTGVNRLSLGVQSANQNELILLEREHGFAEAKIAVENAKLAGFNNISLDLIYGLPYQTLEEWQYSVDKILTLSPEHISLYSLTIEHGTPMEKKILSGELDLPDSDRTADMYDWTILHLARNNFVQYEISNWGLKLKDGQYMASSHNIQYWKNLPYFGVGAGAHGFAGGVRTNNVLSPSAYIDRGKLDINKDFPKTPMTINAHEIDKYQEMQEFMMMGFRLVEEGISRNNFLDRFEKDIDLIFEKELIKLNNRKLIEFVNEDKIRLSRRGRNLGNQVFMEFV